MIDLQLLRKRFHDLLVDVGIRSASIGQRYHYGEMNRLAVHARSVRTHKRPKDHAFVAGLEEAMKPRR